MDAHADPTEVGFMFYVFMIVLPREVGEVCAQLGSIPSMELPPSGSLSRLKEKVALQFMEQLCSASRDLKVHFPTLQEHQNIKIPDQKEKSTGKPGLQ